MGSIPIPSTRFLVIRVKKARIIRKARFNVSSILLVQVRPGKDFYRRVAASLLLNDWPPQRPVASILEVSHSGRLHGTVNPAPYGASVVQIHLPPPNMHR